jgi:hypothetical protein
LEILPSHSLGKEEILPRVGAREVVEPETSSPSNSKFLTLLFFSHGDIALSLPWKGRNHCQRRCQKILEPETCSSSNSTFLILLCCPQVFLAMEI